MNAAYDFDAIVVGSGISGGWAAKELCEKGLKTLVLERGAPLTHGKDYVTEHMPPWQIPYGDRPVRDLYERDYPVQSQSFAFGETTRHFFNNDRENPYVRSPDKPFNWFRGGRVGGKSLIWGRQVYRWSDLDFSANQRDGNGVDWPIRYGDIAPWYSHVEKFIGVSGQAENLPQLPDSEFLPPMTMNTVEKHFKAKIETQMKRTVTIGRAAILTQPHNGRGACHYCGPCPRGCSVGAYFSSMSSTLPAAEKTGNLTLRANSVVEGLDYDPAKKRISAVRVIDAQTGERKRFTAKLVFLCASTVGSLQILLNSKSETFPNGLANRSGTLGHYLMDHISRAGAVAVMPGFEGHYYHGNRPNGVYVPRFRNLAGRDGDADFSRGYGYQVAAMPLEWRAMSAQIPGFGAAFKQALRKPGPWIVYLAGFGECLPYRDNQVQLDATQRDRFGIPQVTFDFRFRDNEQRMRKDLIAQARAMLDVAGAQHISAMDIPNVGGDAIHEMGGARMGADPTQSVLNAHNQAHDVANLFVSDGACMTSSSCVNPSLTYMALTARAVDYATQQLRAGVI